MSGLGHLRSLAHGRRPADDGLLGNTRCAWGGAELLSEESILAGFAACPFDLECETLTIETAQGACILWRDRALVADLYGGRIGRLWRVGDSPRDPREPAIDVAFDPDMQQERGSLYFRADDHPTLDSGGVEPLMAAAQSLVERTYATGKLRVRGFMIRALGNAECCAGLMSIYSLGNELSRSAAFSYAVVGAAAGEFHAITGGPQLREWTPRL